ncbi:MAG TPA: acyltransferase [Prevotellaceae bacterium]|nr:acyltransferase [Prevotellaceae bacterium]
MRKICSIILYKILGWKLHVTIPLHKKSIICVAPHTSNWDFILGILYRKSMGFSSHFLMKKDWFFWPLGILLRHMDGIPINRKSKHHLTDSLSDYVRQCDSIHIAITPEGTRSLSRHWKKGFYFIALKAGIPIQLYALDYRNKTIVCTREIIPSGNLEKDFKDICNYYAPYGKCARFPQKFAIDNEAV